ncbi:hypothetical protein SAMN05443246_0855 [Paenibacillus sp. GP183]|nr:hypothetical protein SAMN05443246_0855 [Paenibacillus sp. GP183]
MIVLKISYLIVLVFFIYMVFKSYRSIKAKQQVRSIELIGASNYKNIFMIIICLFIFPLIITLDSIGKYFLFLLLIIIMFINERVYLGDNGIKIHDEFIPKENILSYSFVEGRIDQFELFIKGKAKLIKITINKRTTQRPIEVVLDEWNKAN